MNKKLDLVKIIRLILDFARVLARIIDVVQPAFGE